MGVSEIKEKTGDISNEKKLQMECVSKIKPIIWKALGEYSQLFDKLIDGSKIDFDVFRTYDSTDAYHDFFTTFVTVQANIKGLCLNGKVDTKIIVATRKIADNIIAECKKKNISVQTQGKIDVSERLYIYFKDFPVDNTDGTSRWPGICLEGCSFSYGEIGIGINDVFLS